ncbi:MAG: Smr/MutS family protein [Geminicoccaceae bacterium]
MRRTRNPTADELRLWHHVVRDAVPLHDGVELPPPEAEPPRETNPTPPPAPIRIGPASSIQPIRRPPASVRLDPHHPIDLDRRTWQRLRRGLYPIDSRLDLHGLTQVEAHDRLDSFLAAAQSRGNRCVLVITGRGVRTGGTLREMTPRWLDVPPNRARVIAYAQAQLHHGGEGAIYVLLRRPRG